jgi:type II secretory pathway component PulC
VKTMDQVEELLAPLFLTHRGRQIGLGVVALFSVLLFFSVIGTLYTWHADAVIMHDQLATTASGLDVADAEAALIARLPQQHIFGAADDSDFLPITSLQLHLTGIIKDSSDQTSKIIVSEAGQPGKVYSVGDMLTSGIKIYSINEDGVVLEHSGRLEKLPLTRMRLQFQEKPKALWEEQNN